MVVIRLARGGSKKNPFYRVVAADKRCPRDGRYIEKMGYFNPGARSNATRLELNKERIDYWISKGAQPSDRIARLLKEFAKGKTAAQPHKPKASKPIKATADKEAATDNKEAPAAEAKADNKEDAK